MPKVLNNLWLKLENHLTQGGACKQFQKAKAIRAAGDPEGGVYCGVLRSEARGLFWGGPAASSSSSLRARLPDVDTGVRSEDTKKHEERLTKTSQLAPS